MYCSACGTRWSEIKMRCPECQRFTPALWLNLYSLSLLITLALTDFWYLWKIVPILAPVATGWGLNLPLATRFYIGLADLSATFAVWVLVLAIPVIFLLKGRKVRVPSFVTSGKLLAVVTWVGLVISLVGIITSHADLLKEMPRFIR